MQRREYKMTVTSFLPPRHCHAAHPEGRPGGNGWGLAGKGGLILGPGHWGVGFLRVVFTSLNEVCKKLNAGGRDVVLKGYLKRTGEGGREKSSQK